MKKKNKGKQNFIFQTVLLISLGVILLLGLIFPPDRNLKNYVSFQANDGINYLNDGTVYQIVTFSREDMPDELRDQLCEIFFECAEEYKEEIGKPELFKSRIFQKYNEKNPNTDVRIYVKYYTSYK